MFPGAGVNDVPIFSLEGQRSASAAVGGRPHNMSVLG